MVASYTNVRYSTPVDSLEINAEYVIVREGIQTVHEEGTEDNPGFDGWSCTKEVWYEKDEYIRLMSEKNDTIEATVDSILTDVLPAVMA